MTGPDRDKFVFRRGSSGKRGKYTQRHMQRAVERVVGTGDAPVNCEEGTAAYSWWRRKLHCAMVECCGLTKDQVEKYGLHSMRRGGNTALWKAGSTKEQRMRIAGWKSPAIDEEYIQTSLEEDLEFATAFGV